MTEDGCVRVMTWTGCLAAAARAHSTLVTREQVPDKPSLLTLTFWQSCGAATCLSLSAGVT